jgi:diguanylate cyclase (GGDEF)-like protein
MIRYELIDPKHFHPFPNKEIQINDITINFLIVVLLLSLIITYVNRHYVQEKIRFYRLSITDELTGVYNRRHLLNCLEDLVRDNMGKNNISLLFIDVNHFKWVNDNFGHLEGDLVLIKLGEILKYNFPICGRFGGDEFVVIIPDTDFSEAEKQADKLKREFEKYVHEKNYTKLSLSIGIFSSKDHNAQEIIHKADEYMYGIKHASR